MDYIHLCEETCFDFNSKSTGSHIQGPVKLGESRAAGGERENGAGCLEIGVFLSPILLVRPFLGVWTGDS